MPREKSPPTPIIRKGASRKSVATARTVSDFTRFVGPEQRAALIAEAAFYRAEARGFASGHEVEDWLAAESEVDSTLMQAAESGPRL